MPKRQSTAYPVDVLNTARGMPTDHALMAAEGDKPAVRAGWKPHREPTTWKDATPTIKAYKNNDFLMSPHARHLRMMAEYEETMQRLAANGIKATVQFFGSARAKDREQYDAAHEKHTAALRAALRGSDEAASAEKALQKLESTEWMIEYMEKTRELARRLTEWSISSKLNHTASVVGVSRSKKQKVGTKKEGRYKYPKHATDLGTDDGALRSVYVCTGGAGGFMEAANRGASDVPGGRSVGMGISLPFEQGLNPYVTDELAFEYHYFFTRKLCMAFHMQALVVAPGGFGTCDEMFEMMTLKQTGKMQQQMPIVLLGKEYWKRVINWDAFNEAGVINGSDVDELLFTDSVDEAFDHIVQRLGTSGCSP